MRPAIRKRESVALGSQHGMLLAVSAQTGRSCPKPFHFVAPKLRSLSKTRTSPRSADSNWPGSVTHSRALTDCREPTTVAKSRCPFAFTLSTAQPFSSLKKVTRSIKPERLSCGRVGVSVRNGSDCGCTVGCWQGALALAWRSARMRWVATFRRMHLFCSLC